MNDPAPTDPNDWQDARSEYISKKLCEAWRWSYRGQRLWSFATHGSTICVIVFSATAAVLAKLDDSGWPLSAWIHPTTAATVLSLLVTIISTVQAKLGFERKWVANRITHSALDLLKIDREFDTKPVDVKTQLKDILKHHSDAITNAASPS